MGIGEVHNPRARCHTRQCYNKTLSGKTAKWQHLGWSQGSAPPRASVSLPSVHRGEPTTAISSLYLRRIILHQGTDTLIQEDTLVLAGHGGHARNPTIGETEARGLSLNSRPVVRLQIPAHLRLQLDLLKTYTHTPHNHPPPHTHCV